MQCVNDSFFPRRARPRAAAAGGSEVDRGEDGVLRGVQPRVFGVAIRGDAGLLLPPTIIATCDSPFL